MMRFEGLLDKGRILRSTWFRMLGLALAWLVSSDLRAQCAYFVNAQDSACAFDTLPYQLGGTGSGVAVNWDFSSGDLFRTFQTTGLGTSTSVVTTPRSLTMVKENGVWYGFLYNNSLSLMYRLTFGNGVNTYPTDIQALNFTTSATVISSSTWARLEFIQHNGNWYAFGVTAGNVLARINFPNGLTGNTISFNSYNNTNGLALNSPQDMDLMVLNGTIYLAVVNRVNSTITIYSLGSNPTNTPVLVATHTIAGLAYLNGLSLEHQCGEIKGLVCSLTDGKVGYLHFGSSILNSPTFTQIAGASSYASPIKPYLFYQNGQWLGVIKHRSNNLELSRIFFGPSLSATPDSVLQYSQISSFLEGWAMDFVEDDGSTSAIGVNSAGSRPVYVLSFDDASGGSEGEYASAIANHAFTQAGQAIVEMDVLESNGLISRIVDTIQVLPNVSVSIDIAGVCEDNEFVFTDFSTPGGGSIVNRSWVIGSNPSVTDSSFSQVMNVPDTFQVQFSASNTFGCSVSFDTAIIVHPRPVININTDSTCRGSALLATNNSSIPFDSISSWLWLFNASDSSTEYLPSYNYTDSGLQTMQVVAWSNFGCVDTTAVTVYIKDAPIADFTLNHTCLGDQTELMSNAGSTVPYTLIWDLGDGGFSSLDTVLHVYGDTGLYTVSLIAAAINGCFDTSAQAILVKETPVAHISVLSNARCSNASIAFSGGSLNGLVTEHKWHLDGVLIGSADSIDVLIPNPGTHVVQYVANSGTWCYDTTSASIFVNRAPEFEVSVPERCMDAPVELVDQVQVFGGQSVTVSQWQVAEVGTLTGTEASFFAPQSGFRSVSHHVQTDSGCVIDTSFQVYVAKAATIGFDLGAPSYCTDVPYLTEWSHDVDTMDAIVNHWLVVDYGIEGVDTFTGLVDTFHVRFANALQVSVALQTAYGCEADTNFGAIGVASPVIEIADDTVCQFMEVSFADNYSGSNYTRTWGFGDLTISSAERPVHIYADTGSFNGVLLLTDRATGCYDLEGFIRVVMAFPRLHFDPDTTCQGSTVRFEGRLAPALDRIVTADWEIDGKSYPSTLAPILTLEQDGLLDVSLGVVTHYGCVVTESHDLFVAPLPAPVIQASPAFGTVPSELHLDVEGIGDGVAVIVLNGDSIQADQLTLSITTPEVIEIEAYVTSVYGCLNYTSKTLNFLNPLADVSVEEVSYEQLGDGRYDVMAVVANRGNEAVYGWTARLDGAPYVSIESDWRDTLMPGAVKTMHFNGILAAQEPGYFCVELDRLLPIADADLSNNTMCVSGQAGLDIVTVYPNPVVGKTVRVGIRASQCESVSLEVFNASGDLMHERIEAMPSGAVLITDMDISSFGPGIYILRAGCAGKYDTYRFTVN
jgi:hypothetical protein